LKLPLPGPPGSSGVEASPAPTVGDVARGSLTSLSTTANSWPSEASLFGAAAAAAAAAAASHGGGGSVGAGRMGHSLAHPLTGGPFAPAHFSYSALLPGGGLDHGQGHGHSPVAAGAAAAAAAPPAPLGVGQLTGEGEDATDSTDPALPSGREDCRHSNGSSAPTPRLPSDSAGRPSSPSSRGRGAATASIIEAADDHAGSFIALLHELVRGQQQLVQESQIMRAAFSTESLRIWDTISAAEPMRPGGGDGDRPTPTAGRPPSRLPSAGVGVAAAEERRSDVAEGGEVAFRHIAEKPPLLEEEKEGTAPATSPERTRVASASPVRTSPGRSSPGRAPASSPGRQGGGSGTQGNEAKSPAAAGEPDLAAVTAAAGCGIGAATAGVATQSAVSGDASAEGVSAGSNPLAFDEEEGSVGIGGGASVIETLRSVASSPSPRGHVAESRGVSERAQSA